MFEDVDKVLMRRAVPEAPFGMADRIIAASLKVETRRKITLNDLLQGFADMFVIPQPAFALAMVLVFGLTIGLNGQARMVFADPTDEMASSFALADESDQDGVFL
jgi:hypothetical protein